MKGNNKSLILIFCLACTVMPDSFSQELEIIPVAGYTITEKMYFPEGGWGKISSGFSYGASIGKRLKKNKYAEFIFSRQDASGSYSAKDYNTGVYVSEENIPLAVNYFQAGYGWMIGLGSSERTDAFAGLSLGAAYVSLKEDPDDKWMLAPGLKLGVRISLNERSGILVQSAYQAPLQRSGQSIYSGTGGTSAESATLKAVNQFSFSAGLIIRIRQKQAN